jgi:chromosome segregation ATPase
MALLGGCVLVELCWKAARVWAGTRALKASAAQQGEDLLAGAKQQLAERGQALAAVEEEVAGLQGQLALKVSKRKALEEELACNASNNASRSEALHQKLQEALKRLEPLQQQLEGWDQFKKACEEVRGYGVLIAQDISSPQVHFTSQGMVLISGMGDVLLF